MFLSFFFYHGIAYFVLHGKTPIFHCFPLFLLLTLLQMSPPFFSFVPLLPTPAPPSLWPSVHCCLCPWVIHIFSFASLFTFFHPDGETPIKSQVSQSGKYKKKPCFSSTAIFHFAAEQNAFCVTNNIWIEDIRKN